MRRIYLVRHCQPAFPDGEKMCISRTDLSLSSEGAAHAAALPVEKTTTLFSSPLRRCLQTAQAFGQPVQILEDLQEMDVGQWEGLTFRQIREQYPDLYAARGKDPAIPPPGGEDRKKAVARFRRALKDAADRSQGDVTVVTHGGILEAFLEEITGTRYKPGYGEIITLSWEDGKVQIV